MRLAWTGSLWFLAATSGACSGLHVQATMRAAEQFARAGAVLTVIPFIIACFLRLPLTALVAATSLAFHPAWTISAAHGDCGATKRDVTVIVFAVSLCCLTWDVLRRTRKHPV